MRHAPLVVLAASMLFGSALLGQERANPKLDPNHADEAQRIWAGVTGDGQEVYLRRTFEVAKGTKQLRLVASCDDMCTVYVDGVELASADRWEDVIVIDLDDLKPGKHVIAVTGKNRNGPAALAAWMTWRDKKGDRQQLVSDKQWRVSEDAAEGWTKLAFDDRKWAAAREQGLTPFSKTVYNTTPAAFVLVNEFSGALQAIERGLERARHARDKRSVLRALDEIERAIMRARRQIQAAKK